MPIEGLPTSHLLSEIYERLQRFEQDLSLRDQRVTRLQQELHQAQAALAAERAGRSKAVQAELDERVRDAERRLAEQVAMGREREVRLARQIDRQRELLAEIETLRLSNTESADALAEARRQLAAMEARPATHPPMASTGALVQPVADGALQETGPTGLRVVQEFPVPAPHRKSGEWWAELPRRQRRSAVAGVAALMLVSLVLAGSAFFMSRPSYGVRAAILTSAAESDLARLSAAMAGEYPRPPVLQWLQYEPKGGVLHLEAVGLDAGQARAALDEIGQSLASRLRSTLEAPAPPRRGLEHEALEARLQAIDQELAAAAIQSANPAADAWAELAGAWRQDQAERETIRGRLSTLAAELQLPPPGESDVEIEPHRMRALESADWKLQADAEALAQREIRLSRLLAEAAAGCVAGTERLQEVIPPAEAALAGPAQAEVGDAEVTDLLARVGQGVSEWQRAAATLLDAVAEGSSGVAQAQDPVESAVPTAPGIQEGSGLARLAVTEPAVRRFVEETEAASQSINRALDALAQGGDQPTKRLVLRNTVARALEEPAGALRSAATGARQLLLSDNVELAAAAQGVAALRTQVQEQRDRLLAGLRAEGLTTLQERHAERLAELRAEQSQLIQRDTELDASILRHSQAALGVLAAGLEERRAAARQNELQRERADALARLAALDQAALNALAAAPPPVVVQYLPAAAAEPSLSLGLRLARAAAWGSLPLLAFGIALGVIASTRSWRRSRQVMAEYAEVLSATSRQAREREL